MSEKVKPFREEFSRRLPIRQAIIYASADDSTGPVHNPFVHRIPDSSSNLDRNIGIAAGNNLLANTAKGSWLALLNPDAIPAPDGLEQLLEAMRLHPAAGMFGSTQLDPTHSESPDGAGNHHLATGLPWHGGHSRPLSALPPEGEVFPLCSSVP
jgi:hypothetical protein